MTVVCMCVFYCVCVWCGGVVRGVWCGVCGVRGSVYVLCLVQKIKDRFKKSKPQ